MRITIGFSLALATLAACSPSQTILVYVDSGESGDGVTDGEDNADEGEDSADDGPGFDVAVPEPALDVAVPEPALDVAVPDPLPTCTAVGWLTNPSVTQLVGPIHHDGNLYWGEWGEDENSDPTQTWWWEHLDPEVYSVLHTSADSPAYSLAADDQHLYVSALERNPIRIPIEGGPPTPIPGPLGYDASSGELITLMGSLYWLNHWTDDVALVRTQLGSLDSEVLLDGPLGVHLTGSEEAGLFVASAAGLDTEILRIDPISGMSSELISLPVTGENVTSLLAIEDELYVVYTSDGTARLEQVTLEGAVTTIIDPGTYTLISRPVLYEDQLYFEIADSEFAWGRVGLDGGAVEVFDIEVPDHRWRPMAATEDCLVIRIARPEIGNDPLFELYGFAG